MKVFRCLMTLVILMTMVLSGCSSGIPAEDTGVFTVVIEDGKGYEASPRSRQFHRGEDVVFDITLSDGGILAVTEGPACTLSQEGNKAVITVLKPRYSGVIRLAVSYQYILYDANGGKVPETEETSLRLPVCTGHLRTNTALGNALFEREGYVACGWNTAADGSGTQIGFGSRTEYHEGLVLYAQWIKAASEKDFTYSVAQGVVSLESWHGDAEVLALPQSIEGLPVTRIRSGCFDHSSFTVLVLPETIREIEAGAVNAPRLREVYCYDSLNRVGDESFAGCTSLKTLHINAAVKPSYSGGYFDTFTDKYDRLYQLKEKSKVVLFSGSSARFGYDSAMIDQAFEDYGVVNMGVYAYTNALPQLRIIQSCMKAGDILLEAPEFDAVETQFCVSASLDKHFFAMTESNYDLVSLLDLREYDQVFTAFGTYLLERTLLEKKDYSVWAGNYDEDGNPVAYKTYNEYGDYIAPRPNGDREEMLRYIRADYTVNAFPETTVARLNSVLTEFKEKGIRVYMTYAPRNISSLTPESTPEERARLHEYLLSKMEVPLISPIEDSLLSAVYFYQIDNHLTDEGVKIRTERVIRDLKTQLEKE